MNLENYKYIVLFLFISAMQAPINVLSTDTLNQNVITRQNDNSSLIDSQHVVRDLGANALLFSDPTRLPYVQVTIFNDFECPYCRMLDESLAAIRQEEVGKSIKVVYRSFPKPQHPWAMPAAIAAVCAAQQDRSLYFQLSDYYYAHQSDFTETSLLPRTRDFLSNDPNFDRQRFDKCTQEGSGGQIVQADIVLGEHYGVSRTPTFFINDQMVIGSRNVVSLRKLLVDAINKGSKTP